MTPKRFQRIGLVARFKPLHHGQAAMLEAVCQSAEHVLIGIGSCNRYNLRNPFTVYETQEMLYHFLEKRATNYSILFVPDLDDGPRWKEQIAQLYGPLDAFITANDYVKSLLEPDYTVIHPATFVPKDKQTPLCATEVREEIARFGDWKALVPAEVSEYLEKAGLIERFRAEFGLETLAADLPKEHAFGGDL